MNLIQVGLTVLFGLAIVRLLIAAHRQHIAVRRAMFWTALWTGGLVTVWFPGVSTRAAHWVGVGRGVDAVLYLSVALLSYLVFRLYVALDRQQQAITRLVSELALRDWPPRAPGHG